MPSFFIETFGCQMNVADSETVAAQLLQRGFSPVQDYATADLIIVNTCSVRAHAENRALTRIRQYAAFKRLHKKRLRLWVLGCMAGRLGEALIAQIPQIDAVIGAQQIPSISDDLKRLLADFPAEKPANPTDKAVSCFVPIMRGCNNFCSYCIVPYVRGRERSIAARQIQDTVQTAVDQGASEVTLLGQNVNSYADGACNFPALLTQLHSIKGLQRIRFITSHPKDLSPQLIRTVAELPKACKHIHLPVQSGSSRILAAMNRGYTREEYLKQIDAIRAAMPEADISTDIIVGFPHETEADFEDTISLVKLVRFTGAFMFAYSPRSGTQAAQIPDDISALQKKERLNRLVQLQNALTKDHYAAMVGKTIQALFTVQQDRRSRAWMGMDMGCKRILLSCTENLSSMILPVTVMASSGKTLICTRN